VAIAAGASDAVWRRFCELIGRSDLTRDPAFATAAARRDRRDQVATIIQDGRAALRADVVRVLSSAGVPAAPVNNVVEMVADPQVQAREMFVELDHPTYGPVKTTERRSSSPRRRAACGGSLPCPASTTRTCSWVCSVTRARISFAGRLAASSRQYDFRE